MHILRSLCCVWGMHWPSHITKSFRIQSCLANRKTKWNRFQQKSFAIKFFLQLVNLMPEYFCINLSNTESDIVRERMTVLSGAGLYSKYILHALIYSSHCGQSLTSITSCQFWLFCVTVRRGMVPFSVHCSPWRGNLWLKLTPLWAVILQKSTEVLNYDRAHKSVCVCVCVWVLYVFFYLTVIAPCLLYI